MLPPIPPSTLEANPQFALLHRHLATPTAAASSSTGLSSSSPLLEKCDASTASINASYAAVEEELRTLRLERAKVGILVGGLRELVGAATGMKSGRGEEGEEVEQKMGATATLDSRSKEVVSVIAELIAHSFSGSGGGAARALNAADYELMDEEVELFRGQIGEVVSGLEHGLRRKCALLGGIAAAAASSPHSGVREKVSSATTTTATATGGSGSTPQLDELVTHQTETLHKLRATTIPTALYDCTNTLISLLNAQADHLQLLIRHLELRKHGAESRHLVTKAQFLSTVAQGLEAKAKVMFLDSKRNLYSPALTQNLEQRMMQIRTQEEKEVEEKRRRLEAALEEYNEVGVDVMRTLARRYGEIEREMEAVRLDVERLEMERSSRRVMGRG